MAIPTRPLGKTGMDLTVVGFGAWAAGGGGWSFSWGPQDDESSIAAIRHAVESGVNWVDTAGVYGLGHSEEVVAAAMAGIAPADRPFIFSKCGLVWDAADPYKRAWRVGAPDSIRNGRGRHRYGGCESRPSTCTRCTGHPTTVPPSRTIGAPCSS